MKLTIELLASDAIALRRFANRFNMGDRLEIAACIAIRQFVIANGFDEMPDELDEDTPTAGEA